MRLSLLHAAAGWVVFAGARLLWPAVPAVDVAVLIPLGLTLLWLLHIVAYATRRAAATRGAPTKTPSDKSQARLAGNSFSAWVRAAAVAAQASLGGSLPDADQSEVLAAYQQALGIAERLKRER